MTVDMVKERVQEIRESADKDMDDSTPHFLENRLLWDYVMFKACEDPVAEAITESVGVDFCRIFGG